MVTVHSAPSLRVGGRGSRLVLAITVSMVMLLALTVTALAHEERTVSGYDMEVGFIDEPVFVGQKSGLEFSVFQDEEPIEGLESTLQAEVIKDDQTRDLPISPRWDAPGWYESYFFPTVAGPYTFHIFGTIEGTAIDETFTSSPDGFSEVESAQSGQFPVQFPPMDQVADQAQQGADAAGLVTIALVLGGAGLVVALIALGMVLAGRRQST